MAHPGKSVSLVSPEATTAAKRRARADVDVTGSPDSSPTTEEGFGTKGARWLHLRIELPDATTSCDWELWLWDHISSSWELDTRNGSGGTVSVTSTDEGNLSIIELPGVERVFVKLDNGAGTFTNGVNVWLGGVENNVLA